MQLSGTAGTVAVVGGGWGTVVVAAGAGGAVLGGAATIGAVPVVAGVGTVGAGRGATGTLWWWTVVVGGAVGAGATPVLDGPAGAAQPAQMAAAKVTAPRRAAHLVDHH